MGIRPKKNKNWKPLQGRIDIGLASLEQNKISCRFECDTHKIVQKTGLKLRKRIMKNMSNE
jgi:hypothetical protein